MTARKVWWSGAWLELGGGSGDTGVPFIGSLLADGVNTGSSTRLNLSCAGNATPFQPGTWVEIDPSLSAASGGLWVTLTAATATTSTDSSTLLQIGTGASSSEAAWATISVGFSPAGSRWYIPGLIAAGTRVAVRVLSAAEANKSVAGTYSFLPDDGLGTPVSVGGNTAAGRGVVLTAPGGTNSKGAWTELTSSISSAVDAISLGIQGGSNGAQAAGGMLIDIGIGGSGSEVAVVSNVAVVSSATEIMTQRTPYEYAVTIPVSSRVVARYATASLTNLCDVCFVGAPRL